MTLALSDEKATCGCMSICSRWQSGDTIETSSPVFSVQGLLESLYTLSIAVEPSVLLSCILCNIPAGCGIPISAELCLPDLQRLKK
jgi:hypothetical protein